MKIIILFIFVVSLFGSNSISQTHDLEVFRLNIPRNHAKTGMPIQPSVYIHNVGSSTENTYSIDVVIINSENEEVYNSTENITNANLQPSGYQRPLFSEAWIPEEDGTYSIDVFVFCDGDENPDNDLLEKDIDSEDLIVGFGWNAYDNIQPYGPAIIYYNSTVACELQSITQWGNSDTFMAGADFVGDTWYAVQYSYNNSSKIFTIDTKTGEPTLICEAGIAFDGMAYDITTETVFANNSNEIYTLDVETGVSNFIGTASSAAGFVGLASDALGNLYGLEGYTGNCGLYSINKTTGEGTLIGGTGLSIMTAQDIACDRNNDVLYGTLAGNQNEGLYKINANNGSATLFEDYANEISGSAITYIPLLIKQSPQNNETGILADANVFAMFHDQLTANDLSGISITDGSGNPVQNINASIIGSSLFIEHDDFAPNTEYTVTIPANSIKTGNFGNIEESWMFTTGLWTNINKLNSTIVKIFPNPTNDVIKIICQEEGIYKLSTLSGKEVASGIINNPNNIIYTTNLSKGIYLLQIAMRDQIIQRKIIIQ